MVDMGISSNIMKSPLPNVTWHSGTWLSTVTPLTDQTLQQFWTYHRTRPYNHFWPYYNISGGFHGTLQRVQLANRGCLLLWTPGPVPFGTCIYSNVETILSWTCHVYGAFEFRTSLGTSILLLTILLYQMQEHFLFGTYKSYACCFGVGFPSLNQVQWSKTSIDLRELHDLYDISTFGYYVCKIIYLMEREYSKTLTCRQTLITKCIYRARMLAQS